MKTRIAYLSIVLFTLSTNIFAQKTPTIKFTSLTFDYGILKEEDGKKECTFEFTNAGNDDLLLTNVRASCGCTTSDFTRTPVKPGKKGYVKATYDPANRPGVFNKSLTVVTNDPNNENITIFIKGDVTPKPKTKLDEYPLEQGRLRFVTNHLSLYLTNAQTKTDTFRIYNNSNVVMEFNFESVPAHITSIKAVPEKLKPLKEGVIIISYDAAKKNDFGYIYDRINMKTNDTSLTDKILYISANISEDFSAYSEEDMKNAPVITIDNELFKFENAVMGDLVEHNFVVTNNGKTPLIIRKVKASCGCTATSPEKTNLAPGESTNIKTSFNTAGRKGNQTKTITVITNDPKKSSITLTITGNVLEKVEDVKGDPSQGQGSGTIYKAN